MSDRGILSADMRLFLEALSRSRGPVMGLDIGTRHIGVALSDEGHSIAFPRGGFRRGRIHEDIASIRKIAGGASICAAVVGMPTCVNENTEYVAVQQFIRKYSQLLLPECGVRIIGFWDESFTTQLAKDSFMKHAKKTTRNHLATRKRVIDGVST